MGHPAVGFVGFGEAARCFSRHLAGRGVTGILAYCEGPTNRPPYSEAFRAEAAALGARPVDTLAELAAGSDVIFSAVVVASAADVGQAIARVLRPGALVVDVNASAPSAKQAAAAAVAAAGGSFVDANLMGAVSIYGPAVPLYCSGDGGGRFAAAFGPLGFSIELAGPKAGTAAMVKMLRSVVTKGMEALLVEALTAATLAGIPDEAVRGICETMDATTFSKFVDMCIRTDVIHAERRAVELDGAAESIRDLGLAPTMAEATAARLRASAALGLRDRFLATPSTTAREVLEAYAGKVRGD